MWYNHRTNELFDHLKNKPLLPFILSDRRLEWMTFFIECTDNNSQRLLKERCWKPLSGIEDSLM